MRQENGQKRQAPACLCSSEARQERARCTPADCLRKTFHGSQAAEAQQEAMNGQSVGTGETAGGLGAALGSESIRPIPGQKRAEWRAFQSDPLVCSDFARWPLARPLTSPSRLLAALPEGSFSPPLGPFSSWASFAFLWPLTPTAPELRTARSPRGASICIVVWSRCHNIRPRHISCSRRLCLLCQCNWDDARRGLFVGAHFKPAKFGPKEPEVALWWRRAGALSVCVRCSQFGVLRSAACWHCRLLCVRLKSK